MIHLNKDGIYTTSFFDKKYFLNSYTKNFIEFQKERWEKLSDEFGVEDAKKHFYPRIREEMISSAKLMIHGIPDAIHQHHEQDTYAIWEYKTGKPTSEKIKEYERDNLWYKLLVETEFKKTADIGVVYFPYNNYYWQYKLKTEDVMKLIDEIEVVREKILADDFPAVCEKEKCRTCLVKDYCEYDVLNKFCEDSR